MGVSTGNTIGGNRTERFWEGNLPLRGSLRGSLRGRVSEVFRGFQRGFERVFRGFQRFWEVFRGFSKDLSQRPSQSAIFLSELRVVLPLIVLPLKTPAILVSIIFPPAIPGPKMAGPLLWAPGFFFSVFLLKNPHAHKVLRLGGGGVGVFWKGGGWKCQFYFYGRGDFPDKKSPPLPGDGALSSTRQAATISRGAIATWTALLDIPRWRRRRFGTLVCCVLFAHLRSSYRAQGKRPSSDTLRIARYFSVSPYPLNLGAEIHHLNLGGGVPETTCFKVFLLKIHPHEFRGWIFTP